MLCAVAPYHIDLDMYSTTSAFDVHPESLGRRARVRSFGSGPGPWFLVTRTVSPFFVLRAFGVLSLEV